MDNIAANLRVDTQPEAPHHRDGIAGTATGNDPPSEDSDMTTPPNNPGAESDSYGPTLLIGPQSRQWRRQLGPLAWAALEHLALAARPHQQAWAAPIGVRDAAAGLAITKDTAARALTTLAGAGLITRTRTETQDGRHRSGYLLHPPDGLALRICPVDQDSRFQPASQDRCPKNADKSVCPANPDTAHFPDVVRPRADPPLDGQAERCRGAVGHPAQAALFDLAVLYHLEPTSYITTQNRRSH